MIRERRNSGWDGQHRGRHESPRKCDIHPMTQSEAIITHIPIIRQPACLESVTLSPPHTSRTTTHMHACTPRRYLTHHTQPVSCLALSCDARRLAVAPRAPEPARCADENGVGLGVESLSLSLSLSHTHIDHTATAA